MATEPDNSCDRRVWVLTVPEGLLEHPEDQGLVDDKVSEGLDGGPAGDLLPAPGVALQQQRGLVQ